MVSLKTHNQIELPVTLLILPLIPLGDMLSPCWYFCEQRAKHLPITCSNKLEINQDDFTHAQLSVVLDQAKLICSM